MSYNTSLLLALLLSLSTLTTILFVALYFNSKIPGLRDWSLAFLVGTISLAFFFFQPPIPKLALVLINHAALMGVGLLALKACYLHTGERLRHATLILMIILGALTAIAYLTTVTPNQPLRYFLGSLISGLLFIAAGRRFTKYGFKSLPVQYLFGLSLIFHGLFNCLRTGLFQPLVAENLESMALTPTDVILYEQLIMSTLFALGIIMVINEAISKELRIQADYDPLTNLFNRRVFLDLLRKNKSLSIRTKIPASLLMIDIDHFKSINDKHGHQVGDQVLTDFAKRVKRNLREEDVVARIGGEEFAILLPNTDKESSLQFAERLRTSFEKNPANTSNGEIFYSISIGVITFDELMSTEEALRFSDLAMYQAKKNGRNLVAYFNPN